jgi:hypothetical protein
MEKSWSERFATNVFGTEAEKTQLANNDGERDGSKADWADKIAHNIAGGSSPYDKGFQNGLDNPASDDDDDDN